jgi:hypothetical protein
LLRLRVEGPREAMILGWSRKASEAELKGVEVCRDRKRGVGGEKRTPGNKVLKDRRAPRRRGRMGTSVQN